MRVVRPGENSYDLTTSGRGKKLGTKGTAVNTALWPLALYGVAVVVLVGALLWVSHVLGESHRERATGEPYESGMKITGSAHLRFDVSFYLIAVFFVIFDLEAAFIIAWAVALHETGWAGYIEIVVFIGILLAALVYLWRVKALDVERRSSGSRIGSSVAASTEEGC